MAKIRKLQSNDVNKMHEWINDYEVVRFLAIGRRKHSLEELKGFIEKSFIDTDNVYFAIEADDGKYAGTVSLKSVNKIDLTAEYAIAIHRDYQHQGLAKFATDEILKYGFHSIGLRKIFLNVVETNIKAINFYEKYGFCKEAVFHKHIFINGNFVDLIWYTIFSDKFNKEF